MVAKVLLALTALTAACLGDDAGPAATAGNISSGPPLAPCPGEDRSQNRTCDIDGGFVCLQVLDSDGQPRKFTDEKDWWAITGQSSVRWDARIRRNKGDSWCVCAECASEVIEWAGCDDMPIRCNATNMKDIYTEDKDEYRHLQRCLRKRCPAEVQRLQVQAPDVKVLVDAGLPVLVAEKVERRAPSLGLSSGAWPLAGALGLVLAACAAGVALIRRRRASHVSLLPVDEDEEEAIE